MSMGAFIAKSLLWKVRLPRGGQEVCSDRQRLERVSVGGETEWTRQQADLGEQGRGLSMISQDYQKR